MKPKMYDVEFLRGVSVGESVKITGEIRPCQDVNVSFRGFLMGEVEREGETYYVSINKTSYKLISAVYGTDTKNWIGKDIVYKGERKCGSMTGKIWEAIE